MAAVDQSALDRALAQVGDRWTLQIVNALLDSPLRFNELQEAVTGISPNVLSQRLKLLEGERLIVARTYSERPARYVYELIGRGRDLATAVQALGHWGVTGQDESESARHTVCGTPMEVRWWCPTCERPAEEDETQELRYA